MHNEHPSHPSPGQVRPDGVNEYFSLWDIESGTSLGTYSSEEDARAVATALIRENGPEYAVQLELTRMSDEGQAYLIAVG